MTSTCSNSYVTSLHSSIYEAEVAANKWMEPEVMIEEPGVTEIEDSMEGADNTAVEPEVTLKESGETLQADDFETNAEPRRFRGIRKNWIFINKFNCAKDALDHVEAENTWSVLKKNMVVEGFKRHFRCNKVRLRGPQCSAQIYLLFNNNSDTVSLFKTDSEHNHDSIMLGYKCVNKQIPLVKALGDTPKRKRLRGSKTWVLDQTFDTTQDADHFVASENTWSYLKQHIVEDGVKRYFRCNKVKLRGPQCSAQIYLMHATSTNAISLFRTDAQHDHDSKLVSSEKAKRSK